MQCWNFSFLGGVEATYENVHLNGLMGKKAGAVLALLALSPGRARPREEIIDLLWPEVDFEEARDRFKQQLTLLRKQLEPAGVAPGSVLMTSRSQAGIATGHQSDVALFQDRLRRAALTTDPHARAQCLREALALYKGEFAPGFYQDVLLTERERLAGLANEAQKRLAALEAHDTPAPPPASPPRTLPRPPHTENLFFGRETERKQIPLLLQQNRLVTLLGPGGTGKTRLMHELQADLPDAHFVPLSTLTTGENLLDTVVAFLDLRPSDESALARLQSALGSKQILLMLDNMEQLVASGGAEAVAALLDTLPAVRILVTSRVKLHLPQECVYAIAPLPPDEAEALFISRARLAGSPFTDTETEQAAIAQLCLRLDGLPLALELAAARAAILTPAQILARLERRFDLLSDRRRDREERHTSLRATLDWGWALLAPDVQDFFARLCVFRGSFSLDAAEAITGEPLAIDFLHSLADASFLLMEPEGRPRFRLLETLREYGREKWDETIRETLPRRHSDFFHEQVKQWGGELKGAGFAEAMTSFTHDYDNCLAALDTYLVSDPISAVLLCKPLAVFWQFSYRKRVARDYLNAALNAVHSGGLADKISFFEWAALHDNLAVTHQSFQETSLARAHFARALEYHEKQLKIPVGAVHMGEAHAGEDYRAAQVAQAGTLHNLANILYAENRLAEAQPYYAQAAEVNRALDNKPWLANNLNGLCCVCGMQAFQTEEGVGRTRLLNQGLAHANEAVALCRALSKEYHLCFMLVVQSGMLLGLERDREAFAVLAEGFALASARENWETLIEMLLHYHYLAFRGAHWEIAAQLLGAAVGMGQRWDLDIHTGQLPHLALTDARRTALTDALGAEHFDRLYQEGFAMPVEGLRALADAVPLPP